MTTGSDSPVPGGHPAPSGVPTPGGDPADAVSRTERIDALAAYFRTNVAGYTSEALRRAALDAGYQPLEVDAAWAVSAEHVPARGPASLVPTLVTIAYIVGTYAVVFGLGSIQATSGLALPALGASLVLGILAWLMLRESRPALANAFKFGVILAIVVPLAIGLVALGACLLLSAGVNR